MTRVFSWSWMWLRRANPVQVPEEAYRNSLMGMRARLNKTANIK